KIRSVKNLLQAEHLYFFLGGLLDQLQMFVDHCLLDLRQGMIGAKSVVRLNETATDQTRHINLTFGSGGKQNYIAEAAPEGTIPLRCWLARFQSSYCFCFPRLRRINCVDRDIEYLYI